MQTQQRQTPGAALTYNWFSAASCTAAHFFGLNSAVVTACAHTTAAATTTTATTNNNDDDDDDNDKRKTGGRREGHESLAQPNLGGSG
jgi:hypothetical protein